MNTKVSLSWQKIAIVIAIAVITFFCFRYTLGNQFTNWDDDYYVTNNKYITAFTPENLKVIFTKDITKNNFHPLCILSLAVNYHFAGLEPWSYYFTNILIHIVNAILVFVLFLRICRRLNAGELAGMVTASFGSLWFAVHPMHVESVAWIAERKDVLYTMFYLMGLLTYIRYMDTAQRKWYVYTFLLFLASCLSKPMAVVFPMSLLCMDMLWQRKGVMQLITEKLLFFVFSLLVGVAAFYTQSRTGAVAAFSTLTIAERFMFAGYGFIMYIVKLFYPVHLSTFYPYPYRYITGELPVVYYAAPFIAVFVAGFPAWLLYRIRSPWFRIFVFGMGFFIVNIVFVLQFISVGAAIMADRYSYVAYIGLLFLVSMGAGQLFQIMSRVRVALIALLLLLSGGLAWACAERTHVWYNSETLLTNAIEEYPYGALLSYKWRGHYYLGAGELDKAMKDYSFLASINAADDKVLANMERIKVMKTMQQATPLQQMAEGGDGYKLYVDTVLAQVAAGDSIAALRSYVSALRINPRAAEQALAAKADNMVQMQQYKPAVILYNLLLKINTSNPFYYFLRGCAYFGIGEMNVAVNDWEVAVGMHSKDVQQSAAYNLSVAYDSLGNSSKAYYYVQRAQELGYKPAPEYVQKLKNKKEGKR